MVYVSSYNQSPPLLPQSPWDPLSRPRCLVLGRPLLLVVFDCGSFHHQGTEDHGYAGMHIWLAPEPFMNAMKKLL